jgi:hypothetical protein
MYREGRRRAGLPNEFWKACGGVKPTREFEPKVSERANSTFARSSISPHPLQVPRLSLTLWSGLFVGRGSFPYQFPLLV